MNMQKVIAELRASADELEQLERGASAVDMVDELKAEIERLEKDAESLRAISRDLQEDFRRERVRGDEWEKAAVACAEERDRLKDLIQDLYEMVVNPDEVSNIDRRSQLRAAELLLRDDDGDTP